MFVLCSINVYVSRSLLQYFPFMFLFYLFPPNPVSIICQRKKKMFYFFYILFSIIYIQFLQLVRKIIDIFSFFIFYFRSFIFLFFFTKKNLVLFEQCMAWRNRKFLCFISMFVGCCPVLSSIGFMF